MKKFFYIIIFISFSFQTYGVVTEKRQLKIMGMIEKSINLNVSQIELIELIMIRIEIVETLNKVLMSRKEKCKNELRRLKFFKNNEKTLKQSKPGLSNTLNQIKKIEGILDYEEKLYFLNFLKELIESN